MAAVAELLLEEINAKEDLSLRLGDALDVKASIGLALILFLATQSAYFIDKGGLSWYAVIAQLFAVACIALAAIFALLELWPRTYFLPDPESDYVARRIEQLTAHYSAYEGADSNISDALMKDQIQWARARIADNQKKNGLKSSLLNYSFWFTSAAVILNILTMLTLVKLIL